LGNPLKFLLSGGQIHDSIVASELLKAIDLKHVNVIADKAYSAKKLREQISLAQGTYTIPPKSNTKDPWTCDYFTYCERHLIEGFFNQMKNFRRFATRYDKLATSFLSTVHICAIMILLK
jgi:transposase